MKALLTKLAGDVQQGSFTKALKRLELFQLKLQQQSLAPEQLREYQRQIEMVLANCLSQQSAISNELKSTQRTKSGLAEYRSVEGLS